MHRFGILEIIGFVGMFFWVLRTLINYFIFIKYNDPDYMQNLLDRVFLPFIFWNYNEIVGPKIIYKMSNILYIISIVLAISPIMLGLILDQFGLLDKTYEILN